MEGAERRYFGRLIPGAVARIATDRFFACALVELGLIAVRREWRLGVLSIFPLATKEMGIVTRRLRTAPSAAPRSPALVRSASSISHDRVKRCKGGSRSTIACARTPLYVRLPLRPLPRRSKAPDIHALRNTRPFSLRVNARDGHRVAQSALQLHADSAGDLVQYRRA